MDDDGTMAIAVRSFEGERDRLRAVAVAAQMVLTAIDATPIGSAFDGVEMHDEITLLREKLAAVVAPRQLDATEGATDG